MSEVLNFSVCLWQTAPIERLETVETLAESRVPRLRLMNTAPLASTAFWATTVRRAGLLALRRATDFAVYFD